MTDDYLPDTELPDKIMVGVFMGPRIIHIYEANCWPMESEALANYLLESEG